MCSKYPYHCIGNSCSQSSTDTNKCRNQRRILKSWFYNKQTSDKCQEHTGSLHRCDFFLQDQKRKNNGKKRRQFIQNGGIRYQQMIDRIKVTEYSKCTKRTSKKKYSQILLLHPWYNMISGQNHCRENSSHQITEKTLLYRWQIPCQTHTHIHTRKEKR